MRLPDSVQLLVNVLGLERALYLVGRLPRFRRNDLRRGEQVILYVPRTLRPDHRLVEILGWADAARLSRAHGGELLKPGNCRGLYRPLRDQAIRRCHADGVPIDMIAEWFGMGRRRICQLLEIPQEVPTRSIANYSGHPNQQSEHAR